MNGFYKDYSECVAVNAIVLSMQLTGKNGKNLAKNLFWNETKAIKKIKSINIKFSKFNTFLGLSVSMLMRNLPYS